MQMKRFNFREKWPKRIGGGRAHELTTLTSAADRYASKMRLLYRTDFTPSLVMPIWKGRG
jgi:hypothetical protein